MATLSEYSSKTIIYIAVTKMHVEFNTRAYDVDLMSSRANTICKI